MLLNYLKILLLLISQEFGQKKGDILIIRKTPAVTIVAACIKAETGVGPSIASGNHICKPICADFPTTPTNKRNDIQLSISSFSNSKYPIGNIQLYSKEPKIFQSNIIPSKTPISPTLFTTMAFIAALFACILVNQKLIKR